MLRVKGTLVARARSARELARTDPEVGETLAALDAVRKARAGLTFAEVSAEARAARDAELATLASEQERLERELQTRSAAYRELEEVASATPADLCKALPRRSALLDLVRYSDRYLAFVVQARDCTVHRIDLGPSAELEEAASAWHEALRSPGSGSGILSTRGARPLRAPAPPPRSGRRPE